MDKKKKNLLIGGLLAIVLLLAVGYAAFATTLTINGTSSIDSRWDVHIKDNGVSVKSSNMATSTRAQKDSQLTASFACELTDPGVSTISYDIIVENSGTFGAKLSSINLTGITDYIDATTEGIEVGDVIDPNGEDTLTVTVSYKNVNTVPTGEDATANITVTLNYVQDDGTSSGGGSTTSNLTTVYAYHTDTRNIGTSPVTDGVSDYTQLSSYQNGKKYFLRYDIDGDNVIQNAYACMKFDGLTEPVCVQGGTENGEYPSNYFAANQATLSPLDGQAGLTYSSSGSNTGCSVDNFFITANKNGSASAGTKEPYAQCSVGGYGTSSCTQ